MSGAQTPARGRLEGKVAFISGGTAGIGKASALAFASEGAKVVLAARREAEGEAAAAAIRAMGGSAIFVRTDVTEPDSVEAAVAAGVREFGALHVLLNNAGGSSTADTIVTEGGLDEFWRVIKVDLFGAYLCARFGVREILRTGLGGSVINVASHVAVRGGHAHAYASAKGGVVALTRSMALDYSKDGVRVNVIAPAAVGTERVRARIANEPVVAASMRSQPLGLVEPEEIAALAVYLASDESRTTTGQTFMVDGGRTG